MPLRRITISRQFRGYFAKIDRYNITNTWAEILFPVGMKLPNGPLEAKYELGGWVVSWSRKHRHGVRYSSMNWEVERCFGRGAGERERGQRAREVLQPLRSGSNLF